MFDTVQLAKTVMTPKPAGPRTSHSEKGMAAYAAMEPASDGEAGELTLPPLGLLQADIERIKDLAVAVEEARAAFTDAEAALAKATREAARLPSLKARAGEVAAAAFGANGHGLQMAQDITSQIAVASDAQSALATLQRYRDIAFDRLGELKGGLRRETCNAIEAAMKRAAERYNMLALELTRATAAMDAALHSLPSAVQTPYSGAWDVSFVPHLCIPAVNALGAVDRSAVEMAYRSVLLRNEHPRLTAHVSQAKGHIYLQLSEALQPSGIPVSTLLA